MYIENIVVTHDTRVHKPKGVLNVLVCMNVQTTAPPSYHHTGCMATCVLGTHNVVRSPKYTSCHGASMVIAGRGNCLCIHAYQNIFVIYSI